MVHVAYRGSAPALNDLVGGQVDLMFDNLPSVYPQVKGGNLIGLATTGLAKDAFAPEFPTVAETVPGFQVESWFGVGVNAKTPADLVAKIEADLLAVCKTDQVKQRLATAGMHTVGSDRKGFGEYIASERKQWGWPHQRPQAQGRMIHQSRQSTSSTAAPHQERGRSLVHDVVMPRSPASATKSSSVIRPSAGIAPR